MIEWDPAFRRDLDSTNWTEKVIRKEYSYLLADHAELAVGKGYLDLTTEFLRHASENGYPIVLRSAREAEARLVLDYQITGLLDEDDLLDLVVVEHDLAGRSRRICERCGEPGQMQLIRGGIDARKVLCSTCQRMYDDAIFYDEAVPMITAAIRDFVAQNTRAFADLDTDDIDAFVAPMLPRASRRRMRSMLKRCRVEIVLAVMRPELKRWWHSES